MEPPSSDRPSPHPLPQDLSQKDLPLVESSGPWFRIHPEGNDPLFFGRTRKNRFDAPEAPVGKPDHGVLYAAESKEGAFIETLGQSGTSRDLHGAPGPSCGAARRQPPVAPGGPHGSRPLPARGGCATHERSPLHEPGVVAGFWEHRQQPDGIRYPARHDPSQVCVGFFDRARGAIQATDCGTVYQQSELPSILNRYGMAVIEP